MRGAVRLATAIAITALVFACSSAVPPTPSSQTTPAASLNAAPTAAPTAESTPTPTIQPSPMPTVEQSLPPASFAPADLSARPLTWFAPLSPMPGRTGSVDFMAQFEPDAPWSTAATHVDVYKLYGEWVAYDATDEQLRTAVADIARRGMVLAVEAGPLDPPPGCGQGVESFAGADEGRLIAQRITAAGGRIGVITLDEPYFFGHVYDGAHACHIDLDVIAANVASYVAVMRGFFPELLVGDIEPTPVPVSAAGLGDWLDAYRRVAGESFAFLHLDADWARPNWEGLAHDIQAASVARGVPVGMIYNGGSAPLRGQWIQLTGERIKAFEQSGSPPDHVIFQSWMVQPDHILPDTDPTTFSGLILTYFQNHDALGAQYTGPGANLALGRPARASSSLSDSPPAAAVDGDFDTIWNSGAGPRQWIEIELDGPHDVAGFRLTVSQYPAGDTEHRVFGRTAAGDLVELHRFVGSTTDGMVLEFTPPDPWHDLVALRVETITSPSWMAWREIEVIAP